MSYALLRRLSLIVLFGSLLVGCGAISATQTDPQSSPVATRRPSPTPNAALDALKRAILATPIFMKSDLFPNASVDFNETSPTRVWVTGFLQDESKQVTLQIHCPYNLVANTWILESTAFTYINDEEQVVPCSETIPVD